MTSRKPTLADAIAWAKKQPCQSCGAKSDGVHKDEQGRILILCEPCGRGRSARVVTREQAIQHAGRLWPRGGVLLCEDTKVEIVGRPDGPYACTRVVCYIAVPHEDGLAILAEADSWNAIDWKRAVHGVASR